MDPEELEALLQELVQATQQVIQSGEELPDELYGLLAQTMERLVNKIDELRSQAVSLPTPTLDRGPFPSSNVNAFKYDPRNGNLFVKFHGKDSADSGPVYRYGSVPKYIYDVFSRGAIGPRTSGQNRYHRWIKDVTPSLGGTLNALIKSGGFPYQRIS